MEINLNERRIVHKFLQVLVRLGIVKKYERFEFNVKDMKTKYVIYPY